jgi:ABC-2 type transport system permease protein
MKTFYWLVKREFWEHRGGFFWAPLISGGVFLLLNVMALNTHFNIAGGMNLSGHMDPDMLGKIGTGLDIAMYVVAGIVLMIMAIIVFFYALGSLYDDRRDRSILFWKSLPISNRDTVLSKVVSATIVAPAIACVLGTAAGMLLLIIGAFTASLHGLNMWALLMDSHPLLVAINMISLIPLYAIWALPTVGWLMFCSAWARSKPFLWALLAPLAAGVIVSWFGLMGLFNLSSAWFWKNIVGRMLLSLIPGGWLRDAAHIDNEPSDPSVILDHIGLAHNYATLASSDLWIGAIAGALLITAAVWLRRWRDDS